MSTTEKEFIVFFICPLRSKHTNSSTTNTYKYIAIVYTTIDKFLQLNVCVSECFFYSLSIIDCQQIWNGFLFVSINVKNIILLRCVCVFVSFLSRFSSKFKSILRMLLVFFALLFFHTVCFPLRRRRCFQ